MSLHTNISQTTDMVYYIMTVRIVPVHLSLFLRLFGDLCNVRCVFLESGWGVLNLLVTVLPYCLFPVLHICQAFQTDFTRSKVNAILVASSVTS